MNADQLDRLFEPWFTTKPDGTGMGMVQARRTMLAVGGYLDIDSRPGEGTRCKLGFPVA